ncbi:Putative symporter yagG [Gluconacetobacter sp. SXCC-1]|nr:MFS transporter [Komagataeibacter rhaeticus]ATU71538.1 MFS transporter [Komagataeibacter xylinus]EGG78128.1 Putative symporter yagG [Gluconacetobacter sp. SXCC-1]WPP21207.1 MFS transporter [Komagataeibacter rhaeticus]
MRRAPAPVPAPPPVGMLEIVAFGAGDMGFNIIWGLMLSYLAYFYTEICLFPVQMVGFMLMAARAASLVTDPAVGLWIDRRPAGRQALPLLRAGIAPFMVLVVLTFVPLPRGWSMLARGIGASIGYMGLCVAYGVVNTAYGVMTSLITAAPDMRLRLATSRMVGATLGGLAISIVTLPAVDWLGHGSRQVGFALFMAGVACVVGGLLWLSARFCHERVQAHAGEKPVRAPVRALVGMLAANRGWRRLTGAMLLTMLGSTFLFGALVYDVRYVMGAKDYMAGWLLGMISLMVLAGCCVSLPLAIRWGTARVMRGGTVAAGAVLLVAYGLPAGPGATGGLLALFGLCVGICNPVCFTLLAHCLDHGGAGAGGLRTVGLAWALNSTASKMAFDIGGSLLAGLLAACGLAGGSSVQSAHAQAGIHAGFLLVPAVLYLLAGGVVLRGLGVQKPAAAVSGTASPPPA